MQKNVSIHIGGMVFRVEGLAHERLRQYMESIRAHFATHLYRQEIMSDVESRVAEILCSQLQSRQVVESEDVDFLIATMGRPGDFNPPTYRPTTGKASQSRRFYRDEVDNILGGVCSGLGHYFNIDTIWFRLTFALLLVASLGVILLVYIVFWIGTPSSDQLEWGPDVKRIFRNPKDKLLGGVASGIAAFLDDVDVIFVRVFFIVMAAIGGGGILIYLVLWFALPVAESEPKVQMRGKSATLSDIEERFKEKGL